MIDSLPPTFTAFFTPDASGWQLERSSFVGREAQLRELLGYVEEGARIVTIFGGPGLGKTRLLRRAGRLLLDEGRPAWFCDLSAAESLGDLLGAVARALGVSAMSETHESASAQLGQAIAVRGPVVVLLDNFERLVPHAEITVGLWSRMAPRALTSRPRARRWSWKKRSASSSGR